jgi:hypothetical protein
MTGFYLAIFGLLLIGGLLLSFSVFYIGAKGNSPSVSKQRFSSLISSVFALAATVFFVEITVKGLPDFVDKITRFPVIYVVLGIMFFVVVDVIFSRHLLGLYETLSKNPFSVVPSPTVRPDAGLRVEGFEEHDWRRGFIPYRVWIRQLGVFGRVIEQDERAFRNDLLNNAFNNAPFETVMPEAVTLTTLFFFSGKRAVKFQRIRGIKRFLGEKLYLPQTCSTKSGKVRGLHLVCKEGQIVEIAFHEHGIWIEPPADNSGSFDIMLLALYEDDNPESGDYVYVDIPKYVDPKQRQLATAEIAVMSDKLIEQFDAWEVLPSLNFAVRPVPLEFKKAHSARTRPRTLRQIKVHAKEVAKRFGDWPTLLDKAFAGNFGRIEPGSQEKFEGFLREVQNIIGNQDSAPNTASLRQCFREPVAVDCVVCTLEERCNLILTTVTWGEQIRKSFEPSRPSMSTLTRSASP